MANKPKIKKKERLVKKKGKREKTTTLSEKKEAASNVSEQQDKGWIHVIPVHDTTHSAVTTRQAVKSKETVGNSWTVLKLFCVTNNKYHNH